MGSNAAVGGPATAAAMAAARGWTRAVQPAVLTGTLGYVVGTPLGQGDTFTPIHHVSRSYLSPLN